MVISVQVFFLLKEKALINPPQLLSLPYGGEGRGIERERKEGRERRERRVEGGKTEEGRGRKERRKKLPASSGLLAHMLVASKGNS